MNRGEDQGCLYSVRRTNLVRKCDQIHQNEPEQKTGKSRGVDPQVDYPVDLGDQVDYQVDLGALGGKIPALPNLGLF